MAIKGKSVIELYNPNTRIKQRYEDENIVTNAFKYLFGQNICAGANQTFMDNYLPLFKKGIGGIILFDSQIEENPDIVIAPSNIGCTGYAGNSSYSGSDLSRGGMNLNETELIDNGMKLVWDFATSQANGDIACVSLTSAEGGTVGYGSNNYSDGNYILKDNMFFTDINNKETGYYTCCVVNEFLYVVNCLSVSLLRLKKYKLYSQEVGLINYYAEPKLIEEKEVSINPLYTIGNVLTRTDKENVYVMIAGTYDRIFDITDFENVKEYSFPLDISDYCVRDKMVYIQTGYQKIEKYSLNDTSAKINEINTEYSINFLSNINGYVVTGREMIDGNDNIRHIYSTGYTLYAGRNAGYYKNNIIIPSFNIQSYYVRIQYSIATNYLATINNLSTPIMKTPAQTMKITYTLTEE